MGQTPLMIAAQVGSMYICEKLIQYNANIIATDKVNLLQNISKLVII